MSGLVRGPILAAGLGYSIARGGGLQGKGYWGWGDNSARQISEDSGLQIGPPKLFHPELIFSQLSTGWTHTLGIAGGRVSAWGSNTYGEAGGSLTPGPTFVPGLGTNTFLAAVSVAAGGEHSLAATPDGRVAGWGRNDHGQIAAPVTLTNTAVPQTISGLPTGARAVQVAAGAFHSLALLSDGRVLAWGDNTDFELGTTTGTLSRVPLVVSGLDSIVSVAAGNNWSMALRRDGTVWVWGSNRQRQLGEGRAASVVHSAVPIPITGLTGVWAIASGLNHGAALAGGTVPGPNTVGHGQVWTWGQGGGGQSGDGTTGNSPTPRHVAAIQDASAIAAGAQHTLALGKLTAGTSGVLAWGSNVNGELGGSGIASSTTPVVAAGVSSGFAFV